MIEVLGIIIFVTLYKNGVGFLSLQHDFSYKPLFSSSVRGRSKSFRASGFETSSDRNSNELTIEEDLYKILGVAPNATKAQMRRKYVTLARTTHPDALIGKEDNKIDDPGAEFSKIARAYEVLSNNKSRKRYDRSLAAKDFTQNVEKAASAATETVVKKVLDDFAVPFIKRTTATTIAGVTAAVETLSDGSGLDLGNAVFSAYKAGKRVNKMLDGEVLREKSDDLMSQAQVEEKKLSELQGRISNITQTRLVLSLETKGSALSSTDAMELLSLLNATDVTITMIDRLSLKHTVVEEIQDLEKTESKYFLSLTEQKDALEQFQSTQTALKNAALEVKIAQEEEIAARKALENAENHVVVSRRNVEDVRKLFLKIRSIEQKVTQEVEATSIVLTRRQEKVRAEIMRKTNAMTTNLTTESVENATMTEIGESEPFKEMNSTLALAEIKELRKQEKFLEAERSRREQRVTTLLSRAQILQTQADEIDSLKSQ